MPSPREVEVAAEHFTIVHLGAIRTRRAQTSAGPYNPGEDFFSGDILAIAPPTHQSTTILVQATKDAGSNLPRKRQRLETLSGEYPQVGYDGRLRRLILQWRYERDGRGTTHYFDVQELVPKTEAEASLFLHLDGRSRVVNDHVWADWAEPVEIPEEWYRADAVEVPA